MPRQIVIIGNTDSLSKRGEKVTSALSSWTLSEQYKVTLIDTKDLGKGVNSPLNSIARPTVALVLVLPSGPDGMSQIDVLKALHANDVERLNSSVRKCGDWKGRHVLLVHPDDESKPLKAFNNLGFRRIHAIKESQFNKTFLTETPNERDLVLLNFISIDLAQKKKEWRIAMEHDLNRGRA